jgi:aqualysin 1
MKCFLAFLALVVASSLTGTAARMGETESHRKLRTAPLGRALSGRYIVVLNGKIGDVLSKARTVLEKAGANIEFEYDTAIKGFAVSGLVAKFLTALLDDDMVEFVEEDQVIIQDASFANKQTSPPSWGLDRIDSTSLPLDNTYKYSYTGKGVYIFIVDTGINLSHNEYSSRAYCGYSAVSGEDCTDFRGHGSHVSGIAGGTTVRQLRVCMFQSATIQPHPVR